MSGRFVVCLRRLDSLCPSCGTEGRIYTDMPGGTVWEPSCGPHNCRLQRRLALVDTKPVNRELLPPDDRDQLRRPLWARNGRPAA